MAKFVCNDYKSLIIPGAGQFVDGVLEVSNKAATLVRKIAKGGKFDIQEVREPSTPAPTEKPADDKGKDAAGDEGDETTDDGDPDAKK